MLLGMRSPCTGGDGLTARGELFGNPQHRTKHCSGLLTRVPQTGYHKLKYLLEDASEDVATLFIVKDTVM